MVFVQHQHICELACEAVLVEDADLRAIDLIDRAYSICVDFGVLENSADAIFCENGNAETSIVEVKPRLCGH